MTGMSILYVVRNWAFPAEMGMSALSLSGHPINPENHIAMGRKRPIVDDRGRLVCAERPGDRVIETAPAVRSAHWPIEFRSSFGVRVGKAVFVLACLKTACYAKLKFAYQPFNVA